MCRRTYLPLSSIVAFLLLTPSCGKGNKDVGTTTSHGGGAGDSSGSGGVTGWRGPDCTAPDGKKFAVGTGYSDGCNSCSCKLVTGEPLTVGFDCTSFVCPDASDANRGETRGVSGGGDGVNGGAGGTSARGTPVASGAGGSDSVGTGGVGTPGGGSGGATGSPIDAPVGSGSGGAGGAGSGGNSVDGGRFDSTGGDAAEYCSYNGRTYRFGVTFMSTDGCNECWCDAPPGGQAFATCTVMNCGDGGRPVFFAPSACPACSASDELCVAYYDGTCRPLQSTCRAVNAATRRSILVNGESCFAKPIGDEICGTQNGQHFWGCGEPRCPTEALSADINCHGP